MRTLSPFTWVAEFAPITLRRARYVALARVWPRGHRLQAWGTPDRPPVACVLSLAHSAVWSALGCAAFADKVTLRSFHHVLPESTETLPWQHTPVPPMVTFSNGIRCVSADKEFLGADVRPDDADDDADDASFQYETDCDDDETLLPARPSAATPPQRAAAAAARRAAEEEEAAEADMALQAPCVRCGAADHVASACLLFARDRGAQHSVLAAQAGVTRDIGDDGTRAGERGARAVVEIVPATPNSLYDALSAAHGVAVTRRVLCNWIKRHGSTLVDGHTLRDWVAFEADKGWTQVSHYAEWMSDVTSWAGPIDCAAFAKLRKVSLHVWRRVESSDSYQRHASFHPSAGPTSHAVNLLHSCGRHYDVLRLNRRRSPRVRVSV